MSAPKIPYPPSPKDVPEAFTEYADSFTKRQNVLLAGLFVFLIFYISMVILFAMVGVWCFLTMAKLSPLKIAGMAVCGTFFLYLVKGFFKRPPMNKEMHIEITEEEQPILFGFIQQLCEELDAPLPNKVFVCPDVNAACMSRTSLINLIVEPKRDLLIGLGLVNCMNLSEFKAVLAHEFGHFCHLGPTNNYAVVVKRIIFDLVDGEDWFDRLINVCKKQHYAIASFAYAISACLWVGRKILWWVLKAIALQDRALSREQEFHADKVAVSAAGSDASTHGLLRARFGMQCFVQAINDLVPPARDHKLYTDDLYLHQDRAASVLRRQKKEAELGLPPVLPAATSGKSVKVFDAEQDELEDQDDTPPMWRTHPSDADREANAKEQFIPAVMDHRSPWILFTDAAELKERMTYKFYRREFRIPKDADLTQAVKVQEYIDNEHADTTYDAKYAGAYDDRPLEPGNLSELDTLVHDSPWSEERMLKVYDLLYEGCREHAEAHADLHKELQSLQSNVVGKPSPKIKKLIEATEKKLDDNWEWFKTFDRRVYLLHIQMARAVDPELRQELVERYRFQLEVQRFYQDARHNFNKADSFISAYGAAARGEITVPNDFGAEVISVLRTAWKALKKIVQDARDINLPAMKNFEEGERLADFILEGKMVPEPPLSELKGVWVQKLMNQLQSVKNRCFRLHFKSVGGILALQEKIATSWLAARRPVAAEIVPAELVPDDAIPVEVIEEVQVLEDLPGEELAELLPLDDQDAALSTGPTPHEEAKEQPLAAPRAPSPHAQRQSNLPVLPPELPVAPVAQMSSLPDLPAEGDQGEPESPVLTAFTLKSNTEKESFPVSLDANSIAQSEPRLINPVEEAILSSVNHPPVEPLVDLVAAGFDNDANSSSEAHEPKPAVATEAPFSTPEPRSEQSEPLDFMEFTPEIMPAPAPTALHDTLEPQSPTEAILPSPLEAIARVDSTSPEVVETSLDHPMAEASGLAMSTPSRSPKKILSLDSEDETRTARTSKNTTAPEPLPLDDLIPLDLDEPAVAGESAKASPSQEPLPLQEVFTLDDDREEAEVLPLDEPTLEVDYPMAKQLSNSKMTAAQAQAVPMAFPIAISVVPKAQAPKSASLAVATPQEKPTSAVVAQPVQKKTPSGTTALPASRPAFGSAAQSALATPETVQGTSRRVNGKRPAVKITLVKPGQKSPFAKS